MQLIFSKNIIPTRKNVLDKKALNILVGGVNFFPRNPNEDNSTKLDNLLEQRDGSQIYDLNGPEMIEIINNLGEFDSEDWDKSKFINCINGILNKRPKQKFSVIIRKDRDIAKGTGTLLAPTDRNIGEKLKNDILLTLYRVKGSQEKGWKGKPFWIPNIKFPNDICFYDTIDL